MAKLIFFLFYQDWKYPKHADYTGGVDKVLLKCNFYTIYSYLTSN